MSSLPVAVPVARPVAQPVAQPAAAKPKPAAVVVAAPAAAPAPSAAPVAAAAAAPAASPVAVVRSGVYPPSSPEQVDARLILEMPLTRIYLLTDGSKKLVQEGTLEVLQSVFEGADVYLLLLGGVRLALRLEVPCLEMAPRNFVFPADGATYGLVVADSIDSEVVDVFRILLAENTSFRSAAAPQPIASLPDRPDRVVSTAHSVASGLGTGSVVVASNIIRGGKAIGGVVVRGGEYLASKLTPNAEASKISPASKERLAQAKFLSGAAVKVSKALVVGAMATTEMMALQLSGALKDTEVGKKLASDPDHPNQRLDAAKSVGKATIGAVLHVYSAIETAVFGVAADAATATVTVVRHKYGAEAGAHAQEGLGVAGSIAEAAHGVSKLGVKSIAKRVAVKSAQDVLTTPAERAAEERAKQEAAAAAGPGVALRNSVGAAMGLPQGMDPLVAMEAAAAVAQLSAASNAVMAEQRAGGAAAAAAGAGAGSSGHSHSASCGDVIVTTATATGATPAIAHARAEQAAKATAAGMQVAHPVKK